MLVGASMSEEKWMIVKTNTFITPETPSFKPICWKICSLKLHYTHYLWSHVLRPLQASAVSLSMDRVRRTWNSLPAALRSPDLSLRSFKRQLKSYLFPRWGCRVPEQRFGATEANLAPHINRQTCLLTSCWITISNLHLVAIKLCKLNASIAARHGIM